MTGIGAEITWLPSSNIQQATGHSNRVSFKEVVHSSTREEIEKEGMVCVEKPDSVF